MFDATIPMLRGLISCIDHPEEPQNLGNFSHRHGLAQPPFREKSPAHIGQGAGAVVSIQSIVTTSCQASLILCHAHGIHKF